MKLIPKAEERVLGAIETRQINIKMFSIEVDILIFSDRNREKEIQLSQVSLIIVFGSTSFFYVDDYIPRYASQCCSVHILPQLQVGSQSVGAAADPDE